MLSYTLFFIKKQEGVAGIPRTLSSYLSLKYLCPGPSQEVGLNGDPSVIDSQHT